MKRSTVNKILSITIALIMWTYVMVEVNPEHQGTFKAIPVQMLNETALSTAGLAIAGTMEYTVEVAVSGRHTDVVRLSKDDIVATASLFGYGKGKNQIQVEVTVPEGLTVTEIKPSKIQVIIEDLVAASKPIEVEVINLEEGTEEGAIELQPQEIEVSGAKSLVNSVKAVQVTLDAAKLTSKAKKIQLSATAIDGDGATVENVRLSTNYVDVEAKIYPVTEVQLDVAVIGEPGNGMQLEQQNIPQTIRIKGPKSILKEIYSIKTEPVDITGITDNAQMKLIPILPESVELCRGNETLTAEFTLRDIVEKEFTYTSNEIVIEGLSSGYALNIQTPSIKVIISGTKSVMRSLAKENLTPTINAGGVDGASVSLPISVKYSVDLNSVEVEPETVEILVTEVSSETDENQEGQGNV